MGLHESWVQGPQHLLRDEITLSWLEVRLLELEGLVTKAIARQLGMTCDSRDPR